MLAPNEFTVGSYGIAAPLSLILPRTKYEQTAIIGNIDEAYAAVLLSGELLFHYFECIGNNHWRGLIIPDVRIEVDENSIFDPDGSSALGSIIRSDTRLTIGATAPHSHGHLTPITLHDDLVPTGDLRAAFSRWQIVIGVGVDKRVLWHKHAHDEAA